MKVTKLLLIIGLIICNHTANIFAISTDQEALAFCKANTTSYIAIVWPIAQGKDDKIEKLFRKYGKLHYKKIVYFNHKQGASLLQDAHPHITNIQEHMKMYFPSSGIFAKPARIYLLTFKDLETAVKCKHAIRYLFDLGYSSIHTTDYQHEAIKLAEFFYTNNGSKRTAGGEIASSVSWLEFLRLFSAYLITKQQ